MCNPFTPATCTTVVGKIVDSITGIPGQVAGSVVDGILGGLATAVGEAIRWMAQLLASWVLIPSTDLCPGRGDRGFMRRTTDFFSGVQPAEPGAGDWVRLCNEAMGPAQQLRGFMFPLTLILLVAGLTWQGIQMVVSRKGEPLLQAVKGVWNAALWGVIGIAGTQLVLRAGDSYSRWVLQQTIYGGEPPVKPDAMGKALGAMMLPAKSVAPFVMILIGLILLIAALVQVVLMVFREGAIVILAGMLQLSAAGTVTRGTNGMFSKTLSWSLSLAMYKPAAASVYAVAWMMMGRGTGRDWIVGLGMFALSIVALPAMNKFFTAIIGHTSAGGGGGLAMAASGAAGGMHAASSLRAAGGNSASEHARYMDSRGPGSNGGGSGGPTGAAPTTGPGPVGAAAKTAPAASSTGAAAGGATAGTAAAGGAAASGGAAATAGTAAAGAATGPAAPIVIGAAMATKAATGAAQAAANTASSAMQKGSQ
jgi:hypothetical protein